jgi:hypothetical protein
MVTQGAALTSVSFAISARVGRSMCSTVQFSGTRDGLLDKGWRDLRGLARGFPLPSGSGLLKGMPLRGHPVEDREPGVDQGGDKCLMGLARKCWFSVALPG